MYKILSKEYPSAQEVRRFRREYELTQKLSLPGVIEAYGLERYQNSPVMLLEDFGGRSLDRYLQEEPLSLEEALELGARVSGVLGDLHKDDVIHKDVNPSNIVWSKFNGQVKLIDFGISSVLSTESPGLKNPNELEGTLAYMSPEQTGRMNRVLDYRSDLYSLGVTLFHILTGRLPFLVDDAMEVVHAHLARVPDFTQDEEERLPEVVRALVLRLMSKTAEERYQNAYGVQKDLTRCLEQHRTTGRVESFGLGEQDVSSRFQIPQKLYGRQRELGVLEAVLEQVERGAARLLLVSGYSGVGKSKLIYELQKMVAQRRGNFVGGKYDLLQRSMPYFGLLQAMEELARQLLAAPEEQLTRWREALAQELGRNAGVLVEMLPVLSLLLGEQEKPQELSPAESENRFHHSFQSFVRALTGAQTPLVLFLDDLQWADSSSLKLLGSLATSPGHSHLLLVGAYRDNEIHDGHPVELLLKKLREETPEGSWKHLHLQPLGQESLGALLGDALYHPAQGVQELARLCQEKTEGNPFFLAQFLRSLVELDLLRFDGDLGRWSWDMEELKKQALTDNVVELMLAKIQRCTPKTQKLLQLAACIGARFGLETLALVYGESQAKTAQDLEQALQEGFLIPEDDAYKFVGSGEQEGYEPEVTYRFQHDRVQQAAYASIEEEQKQKFHLQLGRLYLEGVTEEEQEEHLFDLVSQLNKGVGLLEQPEEKKRLAHLNLRAGQRAKASAAYGPAFDYFRRGVELLAEDHWESEYHLSLSLYTEAAETAYLTTDFTQMEALVEEALAQARSLEDKLNLYELVMLAQMAENTPQKALRTAFSLLERLGIRFPKKPNKGHVLLTLLRMRWLLRGKDVEDLASLPEMKEPQKLAAMRVLTRMGPVVYNTHPMLLPLLAMKLVELSVRHGNMSLSSSAYAGFGLMLCGALGAIEEGFRYGQLALRLLERFDAKELKPRVFMIFNNYVRHWKEPLRTTLEPTLEGYQSGLETGEFEFAAYCMYVHFHYSLEAGVELRQLLADSKLYLGAIEQLRQVQAENLARLCREVMRNWLGKAEDPTKFKGEDYDEDEMLPLHVEANDQTAIQAYYYHKMKLCYHFGELEEAWGYAEEMRGRLASSVGSFTVPVFHFYDALIRIRLLQEGREATRAFMRVLQDTRKKLKKWARFATANHGFRALLVDAEWYHWRGQHEAAADAYDAAIDLAADHQFTHDAALACELASRYYTARGKQRQASLYMKEAHYLYTRWGGLAKAEYLEETAPTLLRSETQAGRPGAGTTQSLTTTRKGGEDLDLTTVMKAAETISGEIVQRSLLAKLMTIVLENAGAQRGLLLLQRGTQWCIEAQGTADETPEVLRSIPLREDGEEVGDLCHGIVNYVMRTEEVVLLDDAAKEGNFTHDRYIQEKQPQSILCTPLHHQGKLLGIFYLENNLTTGAFTPERLEVLQLLSSQIAISMENARLYANMEDKVQERTQKLKETLDQLELQHVELKKTQRKLVQAEKMAGLGTLVAGIAHELNNPSNFIYSGAQNLMRRLKQLQEFLLDLAGEDAPEELVQELEERFGPLETNLSAISEGTRRVQEIVEALRTFSHLDEAEQEEADVVEDLRSALSLVHTRYKEHVEVTCTFEARPLLECWPAELKQAFMNIILNACQAIRQRQEEEKGAEKGVLHVETYLDEENFCARFEDDGCGIPEEHMDKLFEPFFTTHPVGRGRGLGLAVVFGIVEKHRGSIDVDSVEGEGTKVTLKLPLHDTEHIADQPELEA